MYKNGRVMKGGKFEQLACWRLPPLDRSKWECISHILEPEMTVGKET
jgi:hypothetical protein